MPWKEIYDLGIVEFFNYVSFLIAYRAEEEKQMNNWKNTH